MILSLLTLTGVRQRQIIQSVLQNGLNATPTHVLAGIELQKGGSYKTNVDWEAILDENGKLRLSLGLYAP